MEIPRAVLLEFLVLSLLRTLIAGMLTAEFVRGNTRISGSVGDHLVAFHSRTDGGHELLTQSRLSGSTQVIINFTSLFNREDRTSTAPVELAHQLFTDTTDNGLLTPTEQKAERSDVVLI